MPTMIWGNQNNKKSENEEYVTKHQERVQEYLNKFKMPASREVTSSGKKDKPANQDWQGFSWINKYVDTSDDRASRYQEYREMCKVPELNTSINIYADNCLHPDTIINTLKGDFTIKQLCEMYPNGEEFEVWSYNLEKNRVDIGLAHSPRITQKNVDVYEIKFDNNTSIVATGNHPILLRSGIYKNVENLKSGDRVMPFNKVIDKKTGHVRISTLSEGQMPAHTYVWELKNGETIKHPNCIHHINENKLDNSSSNLVVMSRKDHSELHVRERWEGEEQRAAMIKYFNSSKNKERKEKISKSWTEERKIEFSNYMKNLYIDNPILKLKISRSGSENGRFIESITVELVYSESKKYRRLNELSVALKCDQQVILRRIREMGFNSYDDLRLNHCVNFLAENKNADKIATIAKNTPYSKSYLFQVINKLGYKNWNDYQINYENHVVVSIEQCGKSDVYDLTVDNFHNFSANGIFVHNCTQFNINKNVLEIQSENNKVIEILETLYFDTLDINSNIWKIARNMCKLGDEFNEIIVDSIESPKHVVALERFKKPEKIKRIEKDGKLEKFVYIEEDLLNDTVKETPFPPWKIVHFRMEDEDFDPYGKSVLEPGRKIWKKLTLMEDAMLIYRISRAPERRVFYIDVGTLSTKDANLYIEQIKTKFKKKNYINPATGEVDQKADALGITEDFYIPVRQNSAGTRIETLPPGQNLGEIDDVKYFKDQMLKLLGIPSAYLGGTSESSAQYDPKSYLSQQEIQFSRTIERIQKLLVKGLEKIGIIELALNGIKSEDLKQFKIVLTPPSNVDQLMEIEVRNQQFTLVQAIRSLNTDPNQPAFLPDIWIYKHVLGFSDQEINKIRLQSQMQVQMNLQIQQIFQNGGAASAMTGGSGGNITPSPEGMMAGGVAGGIGGTPAESGAGPETGGGEAPPAPAAPAPAAPAPAAPAPAQPGLEIAGNQFVEFDGGNWFMENTKDMKKLLTYIQMYEEMKKEREGERLNKNNGIIRESLKGEFGGLLKTIRGNALIEVVKIGPKDYTKILNENKVLETKKNK